MFFAIFIQATSPQGFALVLVPDLMLYVIYSPWSFSENNVLHFRFAIELSKFVEIMARFKFEI